MMEIERTSRFKRAYKRLKKKHYPMDLLKQSIIVLLTQNRKQLMNMHDHPLQGKWHGYRELHPARQAPSNTQLDSWILIYKLTNNRLTLVLVTTGDHQELKK